MVQVSHEISPPQSTRRSLRESAPTVNELALLSRNRARETEDARTIGADLAKDARSPSLMLVILLATLGVIAYAVFLLNPANRGDWLPYVLVITAETILVLNALVAMWTMLSSNDNPRDFAYFNAADRLFSPVDMAKDAGTPHRWPMHLGEREISVDVFITTYGEPVAVVRQTLQAAVSMHGKHLTWLLDDGRSDEMRDLAAALGARYVRRLSSGGAKAGNVNHALTIARGEYFVIFDADFVASPDFLIETVPFFTDPGVAFVQTPQAYGNMKNVVSRGAGYMQTVFYRFIQPGRNRFNAAFCVGTNVIFRRRAIDSIDGMYTDSKSEDVWTSIKLHERGWRTVYIPTVLAIGDTPDTIEAYTKQQQRWATGGFEIMLTYNPLHPKRRLTLDQRLQYLVTAGFYLTGIAPGILLFVPALQIYLDLAPMDLTITASTWLVYYLGFYAMQIVIAAVTLGSFRWETLLLAAVSFPIYIRALRNAITGKEQKWHVTGASGKRSSPMTYATAQTLTFVFLLLTSVVGGWKAWMTSNLDLALAWNLTNTIIVGAFVITALREGARAKTNRELDRVADESGPPGEALLTGRDLEHDLLLQAVGVRRPEPSAPSTEGSGS